MVVPQPPGFDQFEHDRMIQYRSRMPTMEPITMPAMAPPVSVVVCVPLSLLAPLEPPSDCLLMNLFMVSGRAMVGLVAMAMLASNRRRAAPSTAGKKLIGAIGVAIRILMRLSRYLTVSISQVNIPRYLGARMYPVGEWRDRR
jgi:hypothetical protein